MDWDLEERDGEEFARITDHRFDYEVGRAHYQLNNLFHGNTYLGRCTCEEAFLASPCNG